MENNFYRQFFEKLIRLAGDENKLSIILDVTPDMIEKYRNGEAKPELDISSKISSLYDIPLEEILNESHEISDMTPSEPVRHHPKFQKLLDKFPKHSHPQGLAISKEDFSKLSPDQQDIVIESLENAINMYRDFLKHSAKKK